jgi:hypothetical protein
VRDEASLLLFVGCLEGANVVVGEIIGKENYDVWSSFVFVAAAAAGQSQNKDDKEKGGRRNIAHDASYDVASCCLSATIFTNTYEQHACWHF